MPKPYGPNEQSSERTRGRILDAAMAEFTRLSAAEDPFHSISLARVANRAGISRNGLANHYPSKADLSRALARHLLMQDTVFVHGDEVSRRVSEPAGMESHEELLRWAIKADLRYVLESPSWAAMERVTLVAATDDALRPVALEGYRADDDLQWEKVLSVLLGRLGRIAGRHSATHVAAIYNALLEGAAIRGLVDLAFRDEIAAGHGPMLEAYAEAQIAILSSLTDLLPRGQR